MKITFVKKIKSNGEPCKKCREVEQRLSEAGLLNRIDETVLADERDPESPGMQLAARHKIDLAPFFIVEDDNGNQTVYTIYFKFLKEVLGVSPSTGR